MTSEEGKVGELKRRGKLVWATEEIIAERNNLALYGERVSGKVWR